MTSDLVTSHSNLAFLWLQLSYFQIAAQGDVDPAQLASRLWGDVFYNTERRTFSKKSVGNTPRSFVHFVLEPLYKLCGQVRISRNQRVIYCDSSRFLVLTEFFSQAIGPIMIFYSQLFESNAYFLTFFFPLSRLSVMLIQRLPKFCRSSASH